ncbi:hypothetical protein [Maribellus mangrovi]|uniref:hypothetical protein n=1 Tax=Maribellus mangrovi TaxID=3133146 RepID=UPI0030EBB599
MKSIKTQLIEDSLIIKQIEKICSSSDFCTKDLLSKFLSYVVSEYLAGREEKLKGYSIGVDVFGRNEDFDPSQDALVRIHAGRLRRMLDLYYLKEGKEDQIIIEIPKGGYIPTIGLKEQKQEDEKGTEAIKSYSSEPKLAILPFKDLTTDSSMEYFVRGITEELSVALTKYEDISVYNFNVFSKENKTTTSLKKLANKRGVRFILEGALNQAGNHIKILARLTDLSIDKQIWAESYTRELNLENIFEIQESVSREIANLLCSEYGVLLHQLTVDTYSRDFKNFDTYSAVLKFYYFEVHQTPESYRDAFNSLTRAVENDPESGIAIALLASLYGNHYMLDFPDAIKSFELLGELSEKAIKLSPNSAIVQTVRLFKYFVYNERERFLHLAESCLAHYEHSSLRTGSLALFLSLFGQWEQGKVLLDELMHKNIAYPLYFHGATMLYYYRKKEYEKALKEANKYNVSTIFWAPMLRAAVLGQLDQLAEANKNIEQLIELKPDFEKKARELISRYVKEDSLINHIFEGLRLAGLKL